MFTFSIIRHLIHFHAFSFVWIPLTNCQTSRMHKLYKKRSIEWFRSRMYLYPETPPRCGSAKAVRAREVGIKSSQKCHGLRWQHVWKSEVSVYQRTSLEPSWPWKGAILFSVNVNDIKISKFVESVVSTGTLVSFFNYL